MRIAITCMPRYPSFILLILLVLFLFLCSIFTACTFNDTSEKPQDFNSSRAFQDLEYQVTLGPRVAGTKAHAEVRNWILSLNEKAGWDVETQSIVYNGQPIHNIIAKREKSADFPWIIIGAHYDSRIIADKDPIIENRTKPVPGANDGASGVAVLNELARVIPDNLQANIWLVYFDAEDNGSMPGGEWILGSRAFVENLAGNPDAVVIVDMVADKDLNIFIEKYSNEDLVDQIWGVAESLGYRDYFINVPKYSIIDDHLPFVQAGIPAVDIIDFDYPYWHTVSDTTDKVSEESLEIVGEVVLAWLVGKYGKSQ